MIIRREADESAAKWAARRQSGEMNRVRWREYFKWLSQSEENREAIARYEATLARFDSARDALLADEFESEIVAEFERVAADETASMRRAAPPWTAIAASFGAAAAVGLALIATLNPLDRPAVYASAVGEQKSLALRDGSIATLNTNTEIAVKYSDGARDVEVKRGEAIFEVSHDAARPFNVRTPLAKVSVTGTVFDVRSLPGETTVFVLQGAVIVAAKQGQAATLTAGQKIRIDETGADDVVMFDQSNALSWRSGKARYLDQPLGAVVADLNRYFATPISLAGVDLAAMPVTGEFDLKDQETAVAALEAAFDLVARRDGGRILLSPLPKD